MGQTTEALMQSEPYSQMHQIIASDRLLFKQFCTMWSKQSAETCNSLFVFFLSCSLRLLQYFLTVGIQTPALLPQAVSVRRKLCHTESKMIFLCSVLQQQLVPFMQ